MSLPTVNFIWIGPKLGAVHAAFLRSFVRHGHRTVLHVYERPSDVLEAVELSDAAELLPAFRIVRYSKGGGLLLFSKLLRHKMLKKGLGLYVDCDCYCLRPLEDTEYMYGFEATTLLLMMCSSCLVIVQCLISFTLLRI